MYKRQDDFPLEVRGRILAVEAPGGINHSVKQGNGQLGAGNLDAGGAFQEKQEFNIRVLVEVEVPNIAGLIETFAEMQDGTDVYKRQGLLCRPRH